MCFTAIPTVVFSVNKYRRAIKIVLRYLR